MIEGRDRGETAMPLGFGNGDAVAPISRRLTFTNSNVAPVPRLSSV